MLLINFEKQLGQLRLNADLAIPNHGVTAIFGLSGAGKSSLINLVSGLSTPDFGKIQLNDRLLFDHSKQINLPPEQRNIGYVFQDARLFPHYTVKGNLRYGMAKKSHAEFDQIVSLLGIAHLLNRFPLTLSGGEKQRVAIGRALLRSPDLLLMDEPLSALDLPRKRELLDYLERLTQTLNIPILYVSHSLEELQRLAERVILMAQGKVVAFGELESVWNSPQFAHWQTQNERTTLLNLPILQHHDTYKMTALAIGEQRLWLNRLVEKSAGESVRIAIQSRDVVISVQPPQPSSIRNTLLCELAEVHSQPDCEELKLTLGNNTLWASISAWAFDELGLKVGDKLYAQVKSVALLR